MLSLSQFLNESTATNDYSVVLSRIEFEKLPSKNELSSLIEKGVIEANSKYKVLRIEAVENLNKKNQQYNDERFSKDLEAEEKWVIARMQHLPGIMKRSEEGRQKYIKSRLEKFKDDWKYWNRRSLMLTAVEYDENELKFAWHYDICTESSYEKLKHNIKDADKLAKYIADDIFKRNPDPWSHLTGIIIAVKDSGLTTNYAPTFHIIPMFDEETEKELSKAVRSHREYMLRLYDDSSRYFGD
jgi:hypothetical protein